MFRTTSIQLSTPQPCSQNRLFPPFLISAALAIGLGSNSYGNGIPAAPKVVHAEINIEKKEMKNNPTANDERTHYVSGKIIDKTTCEALPGTVIQIGRSAVGTASDRQGLFKLMIPLRSFADTIKLVISCYGYASKTLNVPARDFPFHTIVELELSPVEENVMTVVVPEIRREIRSTVGCVTKEVTPDDKEESIKRRHSFIQKIKRWFSIKKK